MTTYKVIEQQAGRRWLAERLDGAVDPPPVIESGSGPELNVEALIALGRSAAEGLPDDAGPKLHDSREAELSVPVYRSLKDVPVAVLDDPAFWRWVCLNVLLEFILWRQPAAFEQGPSSYLKYVDGTIATECVPLRMYTRGRLAWEAGDPGLATAVERGTDFWRSHVIRVSVGFSPVMTGALVRKQAAERLTTGPLRAAAKAVNRSASNLLVAATSDKTAADIIDSAWQEHK